MIFFEIDAKSIATASCAHAKRKSCNCVKAVGLLVLSSLCQQNEVKQSSSFSSVSVSGEKHPAL